MPAPSRNHRAVAKYNVTTECRFLHGHTSAPLDVDIHPVSYLGLHSASASGDIGLVQYALSHGQPVNSVLDGVLPLHAACAGGNDVVVKLLINHGADVNAARFVFRSLALSLPRHLFLTLHGLGSLGGTLTGVAMELRQSWACRDQHLFTSQLLMAM